MMQKNSGGTGVTVGWGNGDCFRARVLGSDIVGVFGLMVARYSFGVTVEREGGGYYRDRVLVLDIISLMFVHYGL